jgi:hypothetical protein
VSVHRDSSLPGLDAAGEPGEEEGGQDEDEKRDKVLRKLEGQSTQLEVGLKVCNQ